MLDIDFGFLPQLFCLVMARMIGLFAVVPFYGGTKLPVYFRIMLAVSITFVIIPLVSPTWSEYAAQMVTPFAILVGLLSEILLGAAIGVVCQIFATVFVIGGFVIAQGAGLMMAQEVDPFTANKNTLISQLFQMVFILLVVLTNAHLVLLKMVAESFFSTPPQLVWLSQGWVPGLISVCSVMYEWGIRFGIPVMAALLVVNVGFGLIAKSAPQMNILFLSMPIRLGVALLLAAHLMRFSNGVFFPMIQRMLQACSALLS